MIAQGELGLPLFLGVMQFATQAVIERVGRDLEPEDIIIQNDPYLGGTHLMDVKMVMPFFYRGKLWCLPCPTPATGRTPGAWCRAASTLRQRKFSRRASGYRPSSSCADGEVVQDILSISSSTTSACRRSALATSARRSEP